jgi:hypothetical protein
MANRFGKSGVAEGQEQSKVTSVEQMERWFGTSASAFGRSNAYRRMFAIGMLRGRRSKVDGVSTPMEYVESLVKA